MTRHLIHTFVTHRDRIGDAYGVILPSKHSHIRDRFFHSFPQIQEMHITGISFPPYRGNANLRAGFHGLPVRYTGSVEHSLQSEYSNAELASRINRMDIRNVVQLSP